MLNIGRIIFLTGAVVLFPPFGGAAWPQDTKPKTSVEKLEGLEWLKQFFGVWSTDHDGTMNSRVVGDRWVVNEISFANGPYAIQTLSYDENSKQFVGTWVDGSSSFIWRYKGKLDPAGTTLILEAEGPDFDDPSIMRMYRDSYRFLNKNEIEAVSQMKNNEGEWTTFGRGIMRRKPKE